MEKRRLGRSNLEVMPLRLGGNVFGWTSDGATSFRVLDAFVDAGFGARETREATVSEGSCGSPRSRSDRPVPASPTFSDLLDFTK